MTEKDREQYIEVLIALGGYNKYNQERDFESLTPCQLICQLNKQSIENTES